MAYKFSYWPYNPGVIWVQHQASPVFWMKHSYKPDFPFMGHMQTVSIFLYILTSEEDFRCIAPDVTPHNAASHLGLFCLPRRTSSKNGLMQVVGKVHYFITNVLISNLIPFTGKLFG